MGHAGSAVAVGVAAAAAAAAAVVAVKTGFWGQESLARFHHHH